MSGRIEAIHVTPVKEGRPEPRDRVKVVAGRGIEGDRKFGANHDLTLIEAEVLDRLALPDGGTIGYAAARRNVITRGIGLNALVGRRFRVGDVECLGQRLCEPCSHLERLTARGILREIIHRGGLRADVLTDGDIATGEVVETID